MTRNRVVQVLHLAVNELRSRLNDQTLAMVAIAAPLIFATVTSLAFASFDNPRPVRLVMTTGSAASPRNSLVLSIEGNALVRQVADISVVSSVAQARNRVRDGSADAGIILPAGATLGRGGVPQLRGGAEVLESRTQPLATEVAEAVLQTVGGQQWLNHVVLGTLQEIVPEPSRTLRAFVPRDPVSLTDVPASHRTLTAATYYGSSMAIVFLLFVTTPLAKSLWTERQNNTLERLLTTGASRWAIVLGKAIAAQLIGMVSVATVWLVSTFVFHARWGAPAGVGVLIAATVAAAVALSFAMASVVRTEASMDGLAATVTFVLVLAGGNFVPPANLPDVLRHVSMATPNGWTLRGFLGLATSDGGISAVATPALVLLSFTAVIWLVIAARLKALVSP